MSKVQTLPPACMMAELKGRLAPAQMSKNSPGPACSEMVCIKESDGLEIEGGTLATSRYSLGILGNASWESDW